MTPPSWTSRDSENLRSTNPRFSATSFVEETPQMPDYHQIADQIRSFVQASDQTRDGSFDSLASAYSEACVEVNQRMGRCHRLLQQGLRSEAIQLAESEPRLLDAIAA